MHFERSSELISTFIDVDNATHKKAVRKVEGGRYTRRSAHEYKRPEKLERQKKQVQNGENKSKPKIMQSL